MRRFWSILLLAVFVLPFVSPLFALTTNDASNVPACCRKAGKHHCMMHAAELSAAAGREIRMGAPPERCPYHPQAITGAHVDPALVRRAELHVHGGIACAPRIGESERRRHAAENRSRYTRGPPAFFA